MRPGNHAPLAATAARRHEHTRSRAIEALHELDWAGAAATFAAVAAAARHLPVLALHPARPSQPDPAAARHHSPPGRPALPARQHASDASLRARLTAALQRNRQLADEDTRLRRQHPRRPAHGQAPIR